MHAARVVVRRSRVVDRLHERERRALVGRCVLSKRVRNGRRRVAEREHHEDLTRRVCRPQTTRRCRGPVELVTNRAVGALRPGGAVVGADPRADRVLPRRNGLRGQKEQAPFGQTHERRAVRHKANRLGVDDDRCRRGPYRAEHHERPDSARRREPLRRREHRPVVGVDRVQVAVLIGSATRRKRVERAPPGEHERTIPAEPIGAVRPQREGARLDLTIGRGGYATRSHRADRDRAARHLAARLKDHRRGARRHWYARMRARFGVRRERRRE